MRRLRLGDKILRTRDEGEGRATPLVCVHGAGSSSVVWMDTVRRVSPRRRVVAPDLPGHGQSDPWHGFSIDLYRDAIGTVCARSAIERAILVGHSMGALVALAVAATWPERVAGLVLLGAAEPLIADANAKEIAWSPETDPDLIRRWGTLAFGASDDVMRADLRAIERRRDAEPFSPSVRTSALVLSGADDLVTPPADSARLANALGGAHVVVSRAGHMVLLEQPEAYFAALDEFLSTR